MRKYLQYKYQFFQVLIYIFNIIQIEILVGVILEPFKIFEVNWQKKLWIIMRTLNMNITEKFCCNDKIYDYGVFNSTDMALKLMFKLL